MAYYLYLSSYHYQRTNFCHWLQFTASINVDIGLHGDSSYNSADCHVVAIFIHVTKGAIGAIVEIGAIVTSGAICTLQQAVASGTNSF